MNKLFNKKSMFLALFMGLLLVLVSCGGGGKKNTSSSYSSSTNTGPSGGASGNEADDSDANNADESDGSDESNESDESDESDDSNEDEAEVGEEEEDETSGMDTPEPSYDLIVAVTGLSSGTVAVQLNDDEIFNFNTNGFKTLASELSDGTSYNLSIASQPQSQICEITNPSGVIDGQDTDDIEVLCDQVPVSLSLALPEDYSLLPVYVATIIELNLSGTTADKIEAQIYPSGLAPYVGLYPSSNPAPNSAVYSFSARQPGNYTIRFVSSDDPSKFADVNLQVHVVYTDADSYIGNEAYLSLNDIYTNLHTAPDSSPVYDIALANGFGVAVMRNGIVAQWGSPTASLPATLLSAKSVAAGDDYGVAIQSDDSLAVWGVDSQAGQRPASLPASVRKLAFISADVGKSFMAGITSENELRVWKFGEDDEESLPALFALQTFQKVCATQSHIVALTQSGKVMSLKVGINKLDGMDSPPSTSVDSVDIFCGSHAAAFLQSDGRVRLWGDFLPQPAFDSDSLAGFPPVKHVVVRYDKQPLFITEEGALLDFNLELVREPQDW